jgi:hypothetical protein
MGRRGGLEEGGKEEWAEDRDDGGDKERHVDKARKGQERAE